MAGGSSQFRRQVEVFLSSSMSPATRSRMLAAAARAGVEELIRTGRASPNYELFVDGAKATTEDGVKAEGVITYRFAALGYIVREVIMILRQRSPVLTGRFRDSFVIGIDGRPVMASEFLPEMVKETDEIFITNMMPYNRKVDVQLAGGRKLNFATEPGMYVDAVRYVRRRYRAFIRLERYYDLKFPGKYILRTGRNAGNPVQSPGLIIRSER